MGRIAYEAGGRMAVQLADPDRADFAVGGPRGATDAGVRFAFESYLAYYGSYSIHADRGIVVHHTVARYQVGANPDEADPNSEQVLLSVAHARLNHNGGQLAFGPGDGFHYGGLGDGGGGGDPDGNGQNTTVGMSWKACIATPRLPVTGLA